MKKVAFSLVIAAACVCLIACGAQVTPQFASAKDIPRVSPDDAKTAYDNGAVMVDARVAESFAVDHIVGAVNIPYASSKEQIKELVKDLDKNKRYIFYCSCSAEQTSSAAAYKMNQEGFANVSVLAGGTSAWSNAGYPYEKKRPF